MRSYLRPPLTLQHRRFRAGDTFRISDVDFRVVEGRKAPGDLVLQWYTPASGWRSIDMAAAALLADFFYENEHWLYAPPKMGGEKPREYLKHAMQYGWEKAEAGLRFEKAAKAQRLFEETA